MLDPSRFYPLFLVLSLCRMSDQDAVSGIQFFILAILSQLFSALTLPISNLRGRFLHLKDEESLNIKMNY